MSSPWACREISSWPLKKELRQCALVRLSLEPARFPTATTGRTKSAKGLNDDDKRWQATIEAANYTAPTASHRCHQHPDASRVRQGRQHHRDPDIATPWASRSCSANIRFEQYATLPDHAWRSPKRCLVRRLSS